MMKELLLLSAAGKPSTDLLLLPDQPLRLLLVAAVADTVAHRTLN
jgi:hypothetical protein